MENKSVTLNSGYVMPIYGIGTYSLHVDTCRNALQVAFKNGVRLVDTAHAYGNETEVGEADESKCVSCNACYSSPEHRCIFRKKLDTRSLIN